MLLAETANRQQRDCFLIAFSVNARLIDVTRDRSALLRFFKTEPGGNTDAGDTLRAVFELTRNNPRYAGADVLWITDFRMPLPNKELLGEVEALRQADTRFYGLQIGVAENRWTGYFDEIYHLTDVRTAII